MALNDKFLDLLKMRKARGQPAVPSSLQGVSKQHVRDVLAALDLATNADLVDGVYALLDDETPSMFSKAPRGASFASGATTAQVASHIGILQRGKTKLDREGRDVWIKPLRDLGAIDPVLLFDGEYLPGHPKAKSPNSSYRLSADFVAILKAPPSQWKEMLKAWSTGSAIRRRHEYQAVLAAASRARVGSGHSDLIQAAIEHYAARFLPGFEVIYVDDGDGDRITEEDTELLASAGISFKLGDAMPDVLLWNSTTDQLWVIEAVTSDGEVDHHKVGQLTGLAERSGKSGVGFTTAYRTWKDAAARQGPNRNIAVDTHIWIEADPAKQLRVESFS